MHLIEPLCSGVNGAANGTVDIYRRGTTTRATYYTAFEAGAGSAVTPTASVPLDGNGGLVAYVNEMVQCVAKDSAGATVRSFVAGVAAPAVEVISDSFTGTDYVTAASAVSKPTTLASVLDKWNDSAGANDFKVLVNGSSVNLSAALASASVFYYNVKSTAYGAIGNGVADDTSAIQAAMAAASSAGGGTVFFPPGTYRITSSLSVPGTTIALLGSGPQSTLVKIDHATADAITASSDIAIANLGIDALQANTGALVRASQAFSIDQCTFNASGLCAGYGVRLSTGSGSVRQIISRCWFYLQTTGRAIDTQGSTAANVTIYGNTFYVQTAGAYNSSVIRLGASSGEASCVTGNTLVFIPNSGTWNFVEVSSAVVIGIISVTGNALLVSSGGSTGTFLNGSAAGTSSVAIVEYGNSVLSASIGLVDMAVTLPVRASSTVGSFQGLASFRTGNRRNVAAASVALNPVQYAYVEMVATTNAAFSPTMGQPPMVDMEFTLAWYNNQGGVGGTITMDAFVKGLVSFTVNANSVSFYFFRSVEVGTFTRKWALVGSLLNQTP